MAHDRPDVTCRWGVVVTALTGGLLALAVVLALWLIYRTADADNRARAEVAWIVRTDLERLIEDNPVSDWAPGAEDVFDLTTRHSSAGTAMPRDRRPSR